MKKLIILSLLLSSALFTYATENPKDIDTTQTKIKRNFMTIGYQIGGNSLIGFDYEIRVHDILGIHAGFGFKGYTVGLNIHTSGKRNSPFFNFNYKDAGFGQMGTVGVEYGGRVLFNKEKNNFGIAGQIGFGAITNITPEFEAILYKGNEAPPITLTMGIGLCF